MYQPPRLSPDTKHRCIYKEMPCQDMRAILDLLETPKYIDLPLGIDVEASDLYPNQHSWDFSGFSLSTIPDINIKAKEHKGYSWYFDYKYPHRPLTGDQKEYLNQWLQRNQNRLYAFNCSYELKAFWRVMGRPYRFRDSRGISLAAHVPGSLKKIVQKYCNAHEWETDNGNVVSTISAFRVSINKKDKQGILPAIRERRLAIDLDENAHLETDIYKFLTADEQQFIDSIIQWDDMDVYHERKRRCPSEKVFKTVNQMSKEGNKLSRNLDKLLTKKAELDGEIHDDDTESALDTEILECQTAIANSYEDVEVEIRPSPTQENLLALYRYGLTKEEILQTFVGLTGWYGVPTRILGPYCGWDTYYTLQLFFTFMQDERLANSYEYFEHEVRFAGVLECYNQVWDEEEAEKLNDKYLRYMTDNLHNTISKLDVDFDEDEWGQRAKLFDSLGVGCEFPIEHTFKVRKGGFYNSPKTVTVKREALLEKHINLYTSYQESEAYNDEFKAEAKEYGFKVYLQDDWIDATPEQLRQLAYPIKMRYLVEKGKAEYVEEYDVVIKDHVQRLDKLKGFWNPASPKREVSDKFWEKFLTPRVVTANLFYGLRRVILTAECWEYLDGWMVEIDEQDTEKDGTPKVDNDGDPVFKKEKQAKAIDILQPDGSIETIKEILVDMNDLGGTLGNIMALLEKFKQIPMDVTDTTHDTLAKMTHEQREERLRIKGIHSENQKLRTALQTAIDGLSDYLDEQSGDGLSQSKVVEQYHVLTDFLGLNCNDPSTWFLEYDLLLALRMFKKSQKSRNTYISGAKLGRGQVFEVDIPEGGADMMDDAWHRDTMPIYKNKIILDEIGTEEWKTKNRERRFSLQEQFKPCATDTRRWKSRQHTVPADCELRGIYIPRKKGWLVSHADFSGCELATVGAIANEKTIVNTFRTGGDIHRNTAAGVWGIEPGEVTAMQRRWSKTCTFLCLYGGTVETLARELGGAMDRASMVMDGFFSTYPGLANYTTTYRQHAAEHGYVFTLNGSPLNLDTSDLTKLQCTSINYPIQSSATNLCGSTFYSMWDTFYFDLKLPFVASGFTHDSIDSSYPIQSMFQVIPVQKFLAEYIPWTKLGVPARLDNEIGLTVYGLSEVKILSDITSGTTAEDPHILELEGKDINILPFWEEIQEYFDVVDVHIKEGDAKPWKQDELWYGSRAMNEDQLGHLYHEQQFHKELHLVAKLVNKADTPYPSPVYGTHEVFDKCIISQVQNKLMHAKK